MVYLIWETVTWRARVLEGPEWMEGSGSIAQVAAYLIAGGSVAFRNGANPWAKAGIGWPLRAKLAGRVAQWDIFGDVGGVAAWRCLS
jgi:hypothetical protein